MKKLAVIGGGLIALYLLVYNGTNSGNVINAAASGGTNVIKALQGR